MLSKKWLSLENIIDGNAFSDRNSIPGRIISQNSGCYPTKDKKVIRKLDKIFIFEKIKKLSIALGQGLCVRTQLKTLPKNQQIRVGI